MKNYIIIIFITIIAINTSFAQILVEGKIVEDEDELLIRERIGEAPKQSTNLWDKYDFTSNTLKDISVG